MESRRLALGIRPSQIVAAAKISWAMYYKYRDEGSVPEMVRLRRIAPLLKTTPDDLVPPDAPRSNNEEACSDEEAWQASVDRYLESGRGKHVPPDIVESLRAFPLGGSSLDPGNMDHVHHARLFLEAVREEEPLPQRKPLREAKAARESRVDRDDVLHVVRDFNDHEEGLSDEDREFLLAANYYEVPTPTTLRRVRTGHAKQLLRFHN